MSWDTFTVGDLVNKIGPLIFSVNVRNSRRPDTLGDHNTVLLWYCIIAPKSLKENQTEMYKIKHIHYINELINTLNTKLLQELHD